MTNRLNISPDLSLPLEAVTSTQCILARNARHLQRIGAYCAVASRAETPATYPLDPMPARRRA